MKKIFLSSRPVMMLTLAALAASSASASIIGGTVTCCTTGTFVQLTVPLGNPFGPVNSVGNDNFQSPNLYGFDESQNTTVTGSALALDEWSDTATLAVGTVVASHYIFFDPTEGNVDGTVDFDSKVLGIISSTNRLLASDYLANTGVNYLNPSNRGLEAGDFVTISGLNQIRFNTFASTPGDYVRVLTEYSPLAATPEPGAGFLLAGGLASFLAFRRLRQSQR